MAEIIEKVNCRSRFINNSQVVVVDGVKAVDPLVWLMENQNFLRKSILKSGAIVLRNFKLNSISSFDRFANELCNNDLLKYSYRSTPRTNIGGDIYTATEYPADQHILLHNENSYANTWPDKILFFSVVVSSSGGQTPIADSRKVFRRIEPEIIAKFKQHGVLYTRNFTPGIDLSWQEVFQTEDKLEVERFCLDNDIDFCWNENGPELSTKQICQATLIHQETNEEVWFNQAHLFHTSNLPKELYQSLSQELGVLNMPRNAYYGNGTQLEEETLRHVRKAYEKESIVFDWYKNDILILDNVLMAHGRMPYSGERRVVVAMGKERRQNNLDG